MKNQKILFLAVILLFSMLASSATPNIPTSGRTKLDQNTQLTIYTYNSLLADPGYDFVTAFEQYAGISSGSVQVVYLNDAGTIVTRANAEKANPVADVLVGLDNILVSQARKLDLLTPYVPANASQILPGLVDGLAPDYLLTPYDWGVISLYYIKDRVPSTLDTQNFTLADLFNPDIADQLILENPNISSPGLGFLLSTIALYGDNSTGINGVTNGNWENLWQFLSDHARMTDSWLEAYNLLTQKQADRSIMISYSTSPAYDTCQYDDNSTASLLTHENGTQWGWQQIEGLGLVKNAKHPDLAKKFIDWFISPQLQDQIYQNQWIYPAIMGITTPDCFVTAITSDSLTPLNDYISINQISTNLDSWLNRWENAWVQVSAGKNLFDFALLPNVFIIFVILIPIVKRKGKLI